MFWEVLLLSLLLLDPQVVDWFNLLLFIQSNSPNGDKQGKSQMDPEPHADKHLLTSFCLNETRFFFPVICCSIVKIKVF